MSRPVDTPDWLSAAEAQRRILGAMAPLPAESRPLLRALGHVLAEEVRSPVDLPPWRSSAMDGFAVRSADVRGASTAHPVTLRVVDDVAAGAFPAGPIATDEAARVMTGAPVPEGTDGVIRVEHTDGGTAIGFAEGRVRILSDADAEKNVRAQGESLRRGERVLGAGTILRAAGLAAAASTGCAELRVVRRPRVAVLASGDELVEVEDFGEVLAGRRIVSSNSYALAAQLAELGMEAVPLGIAADTPESLRTHLRGSEGCDALITSAGVSVGEHDHVRSVLAELGAEAGFWRVRARPGSALAFGYVAGLGGIPWFGLPGNPVSTMVAFELFVRPALLRMAGHRAIFHPVAQVTLRETLAGTPGATLFLRVRLTHEDNGTIRAALTGSQSSAFLTSMVGADALLVVPEGERSFPAGSVLPAVLLGDAPLREESGY